MRDAYLALPVHEAAEDGEREEEVVPAGLDAHRNVEVVHVGRLGPRVRLQPVGDDLGV